MSYEINNYCFLGMPVSDVVNELPPSIEVNICESGICVLIDKKFAALAVGVKDFSMNFEYPTLDQMVSEGYFDVPYGSSGGPNALFCRLLLMAAGITDDKYFKGWNNLLSSLVSDLKFLPVDVVPIEINGNPCESGLVHVENRFLIDLAECFAESSELSILNTNKYNDKRDIVNVKCLKNTLKILLKLPAMPQPWLILPERMSSSPAFIRKTQTPQSDSIRPSWKSGITSDIGNPSERLSDMSHKGPGTEYPFSPKRVSSIPS